MPHPVDEAVAALTAIQMSRERLAAAATVPVERHLVFAALLGAMVAAQAAPGLMAAFIEAMLILALGLVAAWDRRRTGMFVNGYRAGRTLPLTLGVVAFALADVGVCIWLKDAYAVTWAPIAGGLLAAAAAFAASLVWQGVYLRELRETP